MDVSTLVKLKPKEEVLEVVREHIIGHLHVFALAVIWFIVPFFFLFPLFRLGTAGVIIFLGLVLSALFYGSRAYKKWYNTVIAITDRRIIDIEQIGFFDRVISELAYANIDDVSYRKKGMVATLWNIGVLTIRTTGNAADIEFSRVPKPARVHDLITDLRETVLDEEKEAKKAKIEELAEDLSVEEVQELSKRVRETSRDQAMEEFFEE